MSVENETTQQNAVKVLLCGGVAGIVTWASIFPLDVIKTRLQAQHLSSDQAATSPSERQLLLQSGSPCRRRLGAVEIAKQSYHQQGVQVFYRGLGVCSIRAFIVNAVQVCTIERRLLFLTDSHTIVGNI